MVTDSLSIHTVKHRSPPGSTLSDHFFSKFVRSSPECLAAQRRFTESLAAYSIITYLLQIKDRHNGNVLMDDEGRLVHIDFGFMLSNMSGTPRSLCLFDNSSLIFDLLMTSQSWWGEFRSRPI